MTSVTMTGPATVSPLWRGRAGMIGLIVAEASLFAVFVVAYLFYLGKSLSGPYPKDVLELPLFNTLCLLSSSVTVACAVRALRRGQARRSGGWFLLTLVLGAVFLLGTAREWYRLIVGHGFTIGTNLFGTTFYSLVGLHASHVTLGVLILALLSVFAYAGALRSEHVECAELVSWYWHFVDGVWVVVFTVVYVVGR
ncbi:MAG TPA: cytochrome c oxidase subunit 3 [Gemmatimonadales bacterium]|nr:cytochrome c oxidase subunit 3 [Gemmatimonadales bacterium]